MWMRNPATLVTGTQFQIRTALFTYLLIASPGSYGNKRLNMVSIIDSCLIYFMLIRFIIAGYHLVKLFTFSCKVTESLQMGLFGCNLGAVSLLNIVFVLFCQKGALFCQKGAVRGSIHKYKEWELSFFPRPFSFSIPWCILWRVLLWMEIRFVPM